MRIKRFVSPDMRQALRLIREEMGPDAVILSNRRVDDGIEITAAVDYEREPEAGAASRPERRAPPAAIPSTARSAPALDLSLDGTGERSAARPGASRARRVRVEDAGMGRDDATLLVEPTRQMPARQAGGDSALATMGEEIRGLRSLLEHQLAGLAFGELERRHPVRAGVLRQLEKLGLAGAVARDIVTRLPECVQPGAAWREALGSLAKRVPVTGDDIVEQHGVVALLGSTGVGKTTSIAKLAARYVLRHGPGGVALITTDSFRVGAHEQLRTFGRILDIPVRVANDAGELRHGLEQFADRRLVLVDTAGISPRDLRFAQQVSMVRAGSPAVRIYLVLSANSQWLAHEQSLHAFSGVHLDGCVITKLDECTSLGAALSLVVRHAIPVAYVSDGQRVPEDIAAAQPGRLVARAVAIMNDAEQRLGGAAGATAKEELVADGHL